MKQPPADRRGPGAGADRLPPTRGRLPTPMLGALEHYRDALLYEYEYRRRRSDVRYYRAQARRLFGERPGEILELACGSGRVTTSLLRDGHRVIGMDLSRPMLRRAHARIARLGRVKRARAGLFRADMRSFTVARRFDLIVMAFNSFEHLYTRADAEQCLARVREHLAPGGRFIFDVQNPDLRWLMRDSRKRWARTKFTHPVTGEKMIYSTNHVYDHVSQVVDIHLYYELQSGGPSRRATPVVSLTQKKYFPAELEALIAANGLEMEARYGDFDLDPLAEEHENQVLICRARTGSSSE